MNNNYAMSMSASFEARKNTQAAMITAGFAGLMLLLMFLLKMPSPTIEIPPPDEPLLIEMNLPEEPPVPTKLGGGGGGGNPVQAAGHPGIAKYSPPQPGVNEESKDIEENDDKDAPPITRPNNPKPVNKVVANASPEKTPPKPVVDVPAPRVPKNVLGKTTYGSSNGGNEAKDYDIKGGKSIYGPGVDDGKGRDGGKGDGTGGGDGTGNGTGKGPRKVSGNRIVINPKNMDAGENLKGKVVAEIRVSPDGIGSFVRAKQGSNYTSGQAIEIIREWLRRNHFNKTSDESVVVYEFNFLMGG